MNDTEEIGCYGADCTECHCETIQAFIHHPGYKYSKYTQALEFICVHYHIAFMEAAKNLEKAYGKYLDQYH